MEDRELLEAAAKAAGVKLAWSAVDGQSPRNEDGWDSWNPLTDDGDALRLAVKLRMVVDCEDDIDNPDRPAAVRRAIVRAAALSKGA